MNEREEQAQALAITCESVGVRYSPQTLAFWLTQLATFPHEVVLRALERSAKELNRHDFCLSGLLERCRAERRSPQAAHPMLPDSTLPSSEEKERVNAIVSQLVRKLGAPGGGRTPQGNGSDEQPHQHRTETERE